MPYQAALPRTSDVTSRQAITRLGSYSFLPREKRVLSILPYMKGVDVEVLASPQVGARFAQFELLVHPGGGITEPMNEALEQGFFVLEGRPKLQIGEKKYNLRRGDFAWLPPDTIYALRNASSLESRILWFRKRYQVASGFDIPQAFVINEAKIAQEETATQHLIPFVKNKAFDMAINILRFKEGDIFPFAESHVMEHGLYMLLGQGIYWLNGEFLEVKVGDFIYMAPFCPQYFVANSPGESAYILYKDVNRDYIEGL